MINASETPAATTAGVELPLSAMSWKARMIPSTVPNSPTNGAMTAIVPMIARLRSSELRCSISAIESASVMSARFFSPRRKTELEDAREACPCCRLHTLIAPSRSSAEIFCADLAQQTLRVAVLRPEEHEALDDDGQADDRDEQEQPHVPAALLHETHKSGKHGVPTLPFRVTFQ